MNKSISRFSFSLLNVDEVRLNQAWNYRNIISPFYRLYFIQDGEGKLFNPTQAERLEKGYLYLIPSFTMCNYYCRHELHQYYVHFTEESMDGTSLFLASRKIFKMPARFPDVENFKRLLALNPGRGLLKSNNPKVYEKRPIINHFKELNNLLSPAAYMETQGIVMQLLSRFLDSTQFHTETHQIIPSKITTAINYIQTHLHCKITVAALATMTNLSADHFSRIFTEAMGERPLQFIQTKRIERVQTLLATTHLSLAEIAEQTGFESVSYLSRTFKILTQQTASEYKKKSRGLDF